MKKLMSIFICMLLVSVVFFSGCEQQNEGPQIIYNDTTNGDTDGDGWADYEDDFPSDPNYHKLTHIWGPIKFILAPGMQMSQDYNLTSPWGEIVVQWVLTNASYVNYSFASENELHNITFDITIPGASNTMHYDYYNMSDRTLTFC